MSAPVLWGVQFCGTNTGIKQEEQTLKCKITKLVLFMSLEYTLVTKSILCLIFLMCVATLHQKQFVVIPVTLK